jgi:hypothetical protein
MRLNIILSILLALSIGGNAFFLTGCKTFKPVIIAGQPDECNDFYSVLQYYSVQGGDSAFVGTVYGNCTAARRDANREKIINCFRLNQNNLEGFTRCVK